MFSNHSSVGRHPQPYNAASFISLKSKQMALVKGSKYVILVTSHRNRLPRQRVIRMTTYQMPNRSNKEYAGRSAWYNEQSVADIYTQIGDFCSDSLT